MASNFASVRILHTWKIMMVARERFVFDAHEYRSDTRHPKARFKYCMLAQISCMMGIIVLRRDFAGAGTTRTYEIYNFDVRTPVFLTSLDKPFSHL